ncbi:MAG TPA: rhodanese-like domain-containing protein [Polyangiaceae bacterium]|jgi:3-mercaptopyruvate sulfurtransferase SseA
MTRRVLLSLFAILACLALGVGTLGCAKSTDLKSLTVDEVATRIAAHDGKTYVFDNNPKDRFEKSHVPGAKWLDYDNVTAADLPADKGATLVFYCASEL